MTFMSWRREYELGIPQIDREHCYLFDLINKFHDNHTQGEATKSLQETLSRLVAYAEEYFQNEERLMRESAFPGWQAHHAEHEKLFDSIFDLNAKRAAETPHVDTDTVRFLKRWLLDHIVKEDMAFADFLLRKAAQKHNADALDQTVELASESTR